VQETALQLAACWPRASVARFDAARAAEPLPPGTAGYWNVIFVDAITRVCVRTQPAAAAALPRPPPPEAGRTQRQGVFVFARGPLPRAVVPEVHAPWWLIGWL
jgi:hypothetical protein